MIILLYIYKIYIQTYSSNIKKHIYIIYDIYNKYLCLKNSKSIFEEIINHRDLSSHTHRLKISDYIYHIKKRTR